MNEFPEETVSSGDMSRFVDILKHLLGDHLRDDTDKLYCIKPSLMFIHFCLFFVLQLVVKKKLIILIKCT